MKSYSAWTGVRVSAEGIRTQAGKMVRPCDLDLILWKSAFYDRGKRLALPQSFVGQWANLYAEGSEKADRFGR